MDTEAYLNGVNQSVDDLLGERRKLEQAVRSGNPDAIAKAMSDFNAQLRIVNRRATGSFTRRGVMAASHN